MLLLLFTDIKTLNFLSIGFSVIEDDSLNAYS